MVKVPKHFCGDALLIINLDPFGEVTDPMMKKRTVLALRVRGDCHGTVGCGTEREMGQWDGVGSGIPRERCGGTRMG